MKLDIPRFLTLWCAFLATGLFVAMFFGTSFYSMNDTVAGYMNSSAVWLLGLAVAGKGLNVGAEGLRGKIEGSQKKDQSNELD